MSERRSQRLARSAACPSSHLQSHISHLTFRHGLTLIELLVVIAVLVTIVAGVIPLLSPNNDARKIRNSAGGLRTAIFAAQAEAARTGRPHGITLRESAPGSGMAIEVFTVEVPRPFAGFSTNSVVTVTGVSTTATSYGPASSENPNGNDGWRFSPQYDGAQLYELRFHNATGADPLPPRMFRVGDTVVIKGNRFLIVDDADDEAFPNRLEFPTPNIGFLAPDLDTTNSYQPVHCIWLNANGQQAPPFGQPYQITRRPTRSSDLPYQLLGGVGIDLQASGVEGTAVDATIDTSTNNVDIPRSFHYSIPVSSGSNPDFLNEVTILFTPEGSVASCYFNGVPVYGLSQIMLCVGRFELGGIDLQNSTDYYLDSATTAEQTAEVQANVNWLNPDSRWITILPRLGSIRVVENNYVDRAKLNSLYDGDAGAINSPVNQITLARTLARDGASATGGGELR